MRNIAFSLALATVLAQAATTQAQSKKIHEQVDPYTGLRTLFLEVSTRTCPGDASLGLHDPVVHLLFSASESNGPVSYFITPELDHGGVLSIRTNDTMDTLVDGKVGRLSTPTGSTVVTSYEGDHSYIHETIPFSIAQADLEQLANAEWFQFRINGTRQSVQRCTDAKALRDLAEFISAASEYAKAVPQVSSQSQPVLGQWQPHIVEDSNTASHLKSVRLTGIETHACGGAAALSPHDPAIELTLSAEQRPDRTVKYFVTTSLTPDSPLSLHRKDSLDLRLDGVTYTFSTPHGSLVGVEKDAQGMSYIHESIDFHVDRRNFAALAKANEIQFQINAPQQSIQRCVDSSQLKDVTALLGIAAGYYDNRAGTDFNTPNHN
jgi:hypothetical protein